MTTETVYTCKDRDGRYRYVGRTKLPLQKRAALHAEQLRTDYLASPLYRFMHDHDAHFAPDDWAIEPLATVNFPIETNLGGVLEDQAIEWIRRTYGPHLLLNCNRPACQSERARSRREYMRQWRERNGQGTPDSYMARKSREHRRKRRHRQESSGSDSDSDDAQ